MIGRRITWAAFAVLAIAACSNNTTGVDDPAPDLNGEWTGSAFDSSHTMQVTFAEDGGAFVGSGTVTSASGQAFAVTIPAGSYRWPNVVGEAEASTGGTYLFNAVFDGPEIVAALSGFSGSVVVLSRE